MSYKWLSFCKGGLKKLISTHVWEGGPQNTQGATEGDGLKMWFFCIQNIRGWFHLSTHMHAHTPTRVACYLTSGRRDGVRPGPSFRAVEFRGRNCLRGQRHLTMTNSSSPEPRERGGRATRKAATPAGSPPTASRPMGRNPDNDCTTTFNLHTFKTSSTDAIYGEDRIGRIHDLKH